MFKWGKLHTLAYWSFRKVLLVDYNAGGDTCNGHPNRLLYDAYILLCNAETFLTYDARGYFSSDRERFQHYAKYIQPVAYVVKAEEYLSPQKYPMRKVSSFLNIVDDGGKTRIPIEAVNKKLVEDGFEEVGYLQDRLHPRWLNYKGNIKMKALAAYSINEKFYQGDGL